MNSLSSIERIAPHCQQYKEDENYWMDSWVPAMKPACIPSWSLLHSDLSVVYSKFHKRTPKET